MVKTKLFTGYYIGEENSRRFIETDSEINEFLLNNNVEVVDIKFSATTDLEGQFWFNALMIYKEVI